MLNTEGESPPDWLFMLGLMHPKMPFALWLPGMLLAHIEPVADQHPQIPSCWAALQPLISQSLPMFGLTLSQVQHLAVSFVELFATDNCPVLPLQGLSSFQGVNSTCQFSTTSNLAADTLQSCIQIVDKNVTSGPRTEPWRILLVTSCQTVMVPFTMTRWALLSSHFNTQHSMNLFVLKLDNLSRKMLWRTLSKALLKLRKITSAAFPLYTKKVTLLQKETKLLRRYLPFMNPCWFCLMIALFFKCLFISTQDNFFP